MTFFNKKIEVMQIEMTPYGRYLYSIGKFKPHSYEFVDDDILYKASGSTEAQEDIHQRILNETPKLKINRSYQDEGPRQTERIAIDEKIVLQKKMTQRQNGLSTLGRSSYSSDNMPSFQVTMLQGSISGSNNVFETNRSFDGGNAEDISGSVHVPQIDIDFYIEATLRNELNPGLTEGESLTSETFSDGSFVDIFYSDPIVHLKEFNSFYEKENFDIEVFVTQNDGTLKPLKFEQVQSPIVNDMLVDINEDQTIIEERSNDIVQYYFDIEVDTEISQEDLCRIVDKLEINSQFLDEELICPDQRTDRFDIYSTRIGPEDLEDCD